VPALRFLPPLLWTACIGWFSSDAWNAGRTGSLLLPLLKALLPWAAPEQLAALHWLGRKSGHVIEYAVLAGLWRRAFYSEPRAEPRVEARAEPRPAAWRAPLGLAVATAFLDELYQATTLTRGASAADVLLDSAGAAAALIALGGGTATALGRLTTALLWIAAAGGTALIALNLSVAAPSGWLWLSAPAAWLALWLWRRRRRGV
jgi:VanZ family protein